MDKHVYLGPPKPPPMTAPEPKKNKKDKPTKAKFLRIDEALTEAGITTYRASIDSKVPYNTSRAFATHQ